MATENDFHLKMKGQCARCGDIPLEFFVASGARGNGDSLTFVFEPCPTCQNDLAGKKFADLEGVLNKAIESMEADERMRETVTIAENAPLALVQVQIEAQIKTLKWVLKNMRTVNDG